MSLLKLESLESGYWKIPILHQIDFLVEEGDMTVVIGPNGAGKSTLMKTIARLLWITNGTITFKGQDVTKLKPHEVTALGLGYVPQESNVFAGLTVEENLRISTPAGVDQKERFEKVYERFPRLGERKKQNAGTLSGGERQMLAVGSALMQEPDLLILDEPTSGLAPQIREELGRIILDINRDGHSIVWVVEEDPEEAISRANRVFFLEAGSITRSGGPNEFLREDLAAMFMGTRV